MQQSSNLKPTFSSPYFTIQIPKDYAEPELLAAIADAMSGRAHQWKMDSPDDGSSSLVQWLESTSEAIRRAVYMMEGNLLLHDNEFKASEVPDCPR